MPYTIRGTAVINMDILLAFRERSGGGGQWACAMGLVAQPSDQFDPVGAVELYLESEVYLPVRCQCAGGNAEDPGLLFGVYTYLFVAG